MFRDFLSRISRTGPSRTTGLPTSGNGASSMHLLWEVPPVALTSAEVTIEVIEPPRVPRLYFWALQVSFTSRSGIPRGAAHMGLQYHPEYPGGGAVNWGGYGPDGRELTGSGSALPSALDNANTRTYAWRPGARYRYRVDRSPDRGWRATVTDLEHGGSTTIRDLWVDADTLASPMVWTEAFARCDDPTVAVRWTDPTVTTADGAVHLVTDARVNYQSYADGGCTNTCCSSAGDGAGPGWEQRTGVDRAVRVGTRLHVAG
ncbi:MAG: hypothetical protein ACK5PP_07355 [Acidimicrobiales bacterium]